jgi:hypothetical protein
MKLDRLMEIIQEMRRELQAIDECIAALEALASGRRKRGRPRKKPLPLGKSRPRAESR